MTMKNGPSTSIILIVWPCVSKKGRSNNLAQKAYTVVQDRPAIDNRPLSNDFWIKPVIDLHLKIDCVSGIGPNADGIGVIIPRVG